MSFVVIVFRDRQVVFCLLQGLDDLKVSLELEFVEHLLQLLCVLILGVNAENEISLVNRLYGWVNRLFRWVNWLVRSGGSNEALFVNERYIDRTDSHRRLLYGEIQVFVILLSRRLQDEKGAVFFV